MIKTLPEDEINVILGKYPNIQNEISKGNLKAINAIIGEAIKLDKMIDVKSLKEFVYNKLGVAIPEKIIKPIIQSEALIKIHPISKIWKEGNQFYMSTKYKVNDELLTYDEVPIEIKSILDSQYIKT